MPRSNSMNGGIIGKDNTPSPSKKVTTFTSNGCFTRTATTATVITIAGGGGASRGGGGAGGVLITECHPLPASTVPVTVGAGGAASAQHGCRASDGSNSVFGSATPLTATAGGAGGGITQPGQSKGGDGGSGGGGAGGVLFIENFPYTPPSLPPLIYHFALKNSPAVKLMQSTK